MNNESEPELRDDDLAHRATEPPHRPTVGLLVGGKYRILRALGEGGMGAVFEAENTVTLKRAAVKWLHPRAASSAAGQERLLREALATSRVRHRNVVDLYDVVLDKDAVVLVMELLTGELLSAHLARSELSLAAYIRLLLPAIEGVAAAHDVGVVHRDIKPQNIFLVAAPEGDGLIAKVIDFGICKTSGPTLARLTHSGIAMGTPRYISYEQLRGERDVDGRSDVYSFGVMLYEALVGRGPYDGRSLAEQAIQFVTTDPASPRVLRSDVPERLSALVCKAIAREREARFDSLSDLLDALRPFADERAYPLPLRVWRGPPALAEGFAAAGLETRPEPAHEVIRAGPAVASTPPSPLRLARRKWPFVALGLLLGGLLFALVRAPNAGARRERQVVRAPAASVASPPSPMEAAPSSEPLLEREEPAVGAPPAASGAALTPPRKRKVAVAAARRATLPSAPRARATEDEPASPSSSDATRSAADEGDGVHRAGRVSREEF